MRELVLALLAILSLGACGKADSISFSRFFNSHDARTELESIAKAGGHEVIVASSGISRGYATGERDGQVSITGDTATRDELLQTYKAAIERALKQSGAKISGRGVTGDIAAFNFNYEAAGVTGLVRVFSAVAGDDTFEIDVLIYEHQ